MRSGLILCLLTTLLMPVALRAMDTRQRIFIPDMFKTLQVSGDASPFSPPVIDLGSDQRVVISFDELSDERRFMRYELIHCTPDWQPDGLVESEYLDGFNQADVEDFEFSRATLVHYVNYRIVIPNEQMRPTIAGNYLLRVYPEDDPDTTILQARFAINDNTMMIPEARVSSRTDIDTNQGHQQLSFTVDTRDAEVDNPYTDLMVVVTQNNRTDNAVAVSTPLRVSGSKAIFEHLRPLIFEAGNEYRRAEFISTAWAGMGVDHIQFQDPLYDVVLTPGKPRADEPYVYDQTVNGQYTVRAWDSDRDRADTEADYMLVDFSLESPRLQQPVVLEGELTERRLDEPAVMEYNPDTQRYEKTLLLKQGQYNYQFLAPGNAIEGNHHETVNRYEIRVYHRPRMSRYYRLCALATVFSGR